MESDVARRDKIAAAKKKVWFILLLMSNRNNAWSLSLKPRLDYSVSALGVPRYTF